MKDASFFLLSEFYRLLHGDISVQVFNIEQPIESDVMEFVKTASVSTLPSRTKDSFIGEYLVNLDVITKVADNVASSERVTDIANEVLDIICPTPTTHYFLGNTDYNIVDVENIGITDFEDTYNSIKILRKVLQFKVTIKQK